MNFLSIRTVVTSLVLTLAIFLFLPFSELLSSSGRSLAIRSIDTEMFKPPPVKEPPVERKRITKVKLPKPKLAKMSKRLSPLERALALSLDIGDFAGDFSLNFGLESDISMVFELSEVDDPPRVLVKLPPFYPLGARAREIEGIVELVFIVDVEGSVRNIQVVSSYPGKIFVESAVNAVKRWKFEPGKKDGQPVVTRVRLPVRFKMESYEKT